MACKQRKEQHGNLHRRGDVVIAGHNDLFARNAIDAGDLPNAMSRAHPRQKLHTLQPGELYYYVR